MNKRKTLSLLFEYLNVIVLIGGCIHILLSTIPHSGGQERSNYPSALLCLTALHESPRQPVNEITEGRLV